MHGFFILGNYFSLIGLTRYLWLDIMILAISIGVSSILLKGVTDRILKFKIIRK